MEVIGNRVVLRSMTREEYHCARKKYVSDPMMDSEPYVYDTQKADEQFDIFQSREQSYMNVGIYLMQGDIIGELSFKHIDREKRQCELGIVLLCDEHKGKEYGSEAFSLAVRYAFDELGMETLYANTTGSNLRMQRILLRLGFRCYLRLTHCYHMNGRWEDRLDFLLKNMEIRETSVEEMRDIVDLAQQGFAEAGMQPDASILESITDEETRVWSCYARGVLVGMISVCDTSRIGAILVLKRYQRQGIARKLIQTVIDELKHLDVSEVTVYAPDETHLVFERMGFSATGEVISKNDILYRSMRLRIAGQMAQ